MATRIVPIASVQLWMVHQIGADYVFGAELAYPPPATVKRLDCSEYLEGGCAAAGVVPRYPDGAYWQLEHIRQHGRELTVAEALRINGAVLFIGDGTGVGRDAITHTAMSLGDGERTLEARGRRWKVGIFPNAASRGWSYAGLIPGVDYTPQEDDMFESADRAMLKRLETAVLGDGKKLRPLRTPIGETNRGVAKLVAQNAALTEAISALATGQGADPKAILAAAKAGATEAVREVLGSLDG